MALQKTLDIINFKKLLDDKRQSTDPDLKNIFDVPTWTEEKETVLNFTVKKLIVQLTNTIVLLNMHSHPDRPSYNIETEYNPDFFAKELTYTSKKEIINQTANDGYLFDLSNKEVLSVGNCTNLELIRTCQNIIDSLVTILNLYEFTEPDLYVFPEIEPMGSEQLVNECIKQAVIVNHVKNANDLYKLIVLIFDYFEQIVIEPDELILS